MRPKQLQSVAQNNVVKIREGGEASQQSGWTTDIKEEIAAKRPVKTIETLQTPDRPMFTIKTEIDLF